MNKPVRIQRKREKGWRMPENTVYVGRPGPWANPFRVGRDATWADPRPPEYRRNIVYALPANAAEVVANYQAFVGFHLRINDGRYDYVDIRDLRGKNLACFCPLDQPCHADVLLEIANSEEYRA